MFIFGFNLLAMPAADAIVTAVIATTGQHSKCEYCQQLSRNY